MHVENLSAKSGRRRLSGIIFCFAPILTSEAIKVDSVTLTGKASLLSLKMYSMNRVIKKTANRLHSQETQSLQMKKMMNMRKIPIKISKIVKKSPQVKVVIPQTMT